MVERKAFLQITKAMILGLKNSLVDPRVKIKQSILKELAEMLGVSPSRISEYMTGKSEPTLRVARLLREKLDIDADFLLG